MTKAPVYYALAQAQFNPVTAMAKYVDEIQDILRREGIPFLSRKKSRNCSSWGCWASAD